MSAADDLRRRLERLVADAREAGELDALRAAWDGLAREPRTAPAAPAAAAAPAAPGDPGTSDVPARFGMVGDSPSMQAVFELIEKVAPSDVPVLIQGETGTGKELVARALHEGSHRRSKPFLAENCAAVPANLLESELFGHKRGSFTGAVEDRPGHFVAADGGTVFLDEIGDMPLDMQAKLLRVLQDGEVRPVGSNRTRRVDVRVVAATNKDLTAMCREGAFREDLFFRLDVVTIELPPLRERPGDVEHLARHIAGRVGRELGRPVGIRPAAIAALRRWSWPGNVRELENEIRRAAVFAKEAIGPEDLSPRITGVGA
jgi:transcriptional regulator with GAF, ATPase, and Fis domain